MEQQPRRFTQRGPFAVTWFGAPLLVPMSAFAAHGTSGQGSATAMPVAATAAPPAPAMDPAAIVQRVNPAVATVVKE